MGRRRFSKSRTLAFVVIGLTLMVVAAAYAAIVGDPTRGKVVFQQSCSLCHGADAKGAGYLAPSLPVPPADFTNCRITSEDPVEMVEGVVRHGGPWAGLSPAMPAWEGTLSDQQIADVASYVKTLCTDPNWVPGELNLPRALVTGKAFPEQEAILGGRFGRNGKKVTELFAELEYRVNGRTGIEVTPRYQWMSGTGGSESGLGDTSISVRHVIAWDPVQLWLATIGLELSLPTGSKTRGLGMGEVVWEPFVRGGWDWHQFVLQTSFALVLPTETSNTNAAFAYDVAIGRYFQPDPRLQITPMIEFNSETHMTGAAKGETMSAVLPEVRVKWLQWSAAVGVQVPMTGLRDFDVRPLFDIVYEYTF
jgi:mono/diheme cytochrome c family protein